MTEVTEKVESMTYSRKFTLLNLFGLHVRPATKIAEIALQYPNTEVTIKDEKNIEADAKVPLTILTIARPRGAQYLVTGVGPKAKEVVDRIVDASISRFYVDGD